MCKFSPSLSKPANTLYRHNLTATLETAIRGSSSATDHPDVLRRLDARMLEFSHGEIGWDVFTLEYKVDPPVDVVLDSSSMGIYTRMFTHLWRIKRTEYALNEAWKRVTNGSRWFTKVTGKSPIFKASLTSILQLTFAYRIAARFPPNSNCTLRDDPFRSATAILLSSRSDRLLVGCT